MAEFDYFYPPSHNFATIPKPDIVLETPMFPQLPSSSLAPMTLMKSYHKEVSLETFFPMFFPHTKFNSGN